MMNRTLLILVFICLQYAAPAQLVAAFSTTNTNPDCNNQCIDFTDNTTGGTPVFWHWSFPGATPATSSQQFPVNICYATEGVYDVTLIVSDGTSSDTLTQIAYIVRENVPGAFVSPDAAAPFGTSVQLHAGATAPGVTVLWSPSTGLSSVTNPDPLATPDHTTLYSVTITDPGTGCSSVLYTTVTVLQDNNLFVPTAFSPNGDNYNDILYLRGNNLRTVDFSIFDRWGKKVFETNNADKGWDGNIQGSKAEAGVYTYTAVITYADGVRQAISGKTSLVR
jgi:gliding motility-associated-like protein